LRRKVRTLEKRFWRREAEAAQHEHD
jgi:hypothetical protein